MSTFMRRTISPRASRSPQAIAACWPKLRDRSMTRTNLKRRFNLSSSSSDSSGLPSFTKMSSSRSSSGTAPTWRPMTRSTSAQSDSAR